MKSKLLIAFVLAAMASPAAAQMGQGYNSQWNGPFSGWMPWQGFGFGPAGPDMSGYAMMRGWGDPTGYGRGRFGKIDANEDGTVSVEEAASNADMTFAAMDINDDGSLSLEEYMNARMGPQLGYNQDREAAMQARKSARFDPMDTDKDNAISKAEFIAASKAHFDAADTDGDGKVTPWEMRSSNWD